ncbi:MAG: NADPH:quinone reductase [Frankiaceae bacterium]|nr:NADPH:quinone reductase [Frankiaceae bacterium]
MTQASSDVGLELRSLVTPESTLELSLVEVPIARPEPNEVLIRVEATPINPSDLGLLFAGVDVSTATVAGPPDNPVVTAPLSPGAMRSLAARVAVSLPVGNEGAGTVIEAGSSPTAQALLGKTVALAGGGMYAQYRCVDASLCLPLADGTPASAGASSFVNPLTALGMVETMRREGHSGLVHTAAASNLGQMLTKLCLAEDVPLVNIVRKPEQEDLLRALGAVHVCNSTSPSFMDDLIEALRATSATLAFDAVGGGPLASQILTGMEVASTATGGAYSRYGSTTHKQVYLYGGLDRGPTVLNRNFGMAWGVGGWLLTPFLQSITPDRFQALTQRVAAELQTTFASTYTKEVSLAEALRPEAFAVYAMASTGEKYLIAPHKD